MKKPYIFLLFVVLIVLMSALAGCSDTYKLSFTQDEYTVISGIEFVPELTIRPKDSAYELSSSNITIAKPKDSTTLLTLREGIVTITVTSGDMSDTATLYISNDIDYDTTNIKFADTATINFVITNYALAGLTTENYGTSVTTIKGGYASFDFEPYIKGYYVYSWYKDRACTQLFNMATDSIEDDTTLYAYIEERETAYTVTNGLIVGLIYDNLAHTVLNLPTQTENGIEIIGIADNAFTGDTGITTVNIPYTYITIGDSAFAGCSNLTAVNFIGGTSQMEVIGTNAFGITIDDDDTETANCSKLETFTLASTVYEIGAYAFYKCSKLTFDGIPSRVSVLPQYCFAYTKINNVNLSGVTKIYEGAFYNCTALATVTNSQNVTHCYQYAFDNTLLYSNAVENYVGATTKVDANAVVYADTMAVGIYYRFGYPVGLGSGDIHLSSTCTLIADKAFYGSNLTELSLYIDTEKAAELLTSGTYDFIGYDVFNTTVGTNIIVPYASVAAYKTKYSDYTDIICYEDIIDVDTVGKNYGTHKVFVFETDSVKTYYYHKYTGTATKVYLNELGNYAFAVFKRISSFAFSNITTVTEINLGNIKQIAPLAITGSCTSLTAIFLTSCTVPPTLDDASSFQFSTLRADCFIYVSSKTEYETAWSGYTTAINRLRLI